MLWLSPFLNSKFFYPLLVLAVISAVMAERWNHGRVKYNQGFNVATIQWQEVVRVATEKAKDERESIEREVMLLSDPDVDSALASGNWLRRDEDY